MDDFKLKVLLSILSGIVFSFLFILLAFTIPLDKVEYQKIPTTKLGKIAESFKNR